MFNKYKFLTSDEKKIAYLLSNARIDYNCIKGLSPRKLELYLNLYIKELSDINEKSDYNLEREVTDSNINTIFRFRKYKFKPKRVLNILRPVLSTNISKYPNNRIILKKTKMRYALSKAFSFLAIIFSILLFTSSSYNLFGYKKDSVQIKKISASVSEIVDVKKETTKKENFIIDDYSKYLNYSLLDVDFNKLKKQNDETNAWVKVNGTNINYPVVKHSDNEYYLKHSFDKSNNKKGWVFLDYRNNIENPDKNNIIYAHGLVNNMMFGSMRNIFKSSWQKNKNNRIINISTPNTKQMWEVFSTYKVEPEEYYITTDFSDVDFSEFVSNIKQRSEFNYNVDVSGNDKILTLSSCYDKARRMVLHAKLIYYEKR